MDWWVALAIGICTGAGMLSFRYTKAWHRLGKAAIPFLFSIICISIGARIGLEFAASHPNEIDGFRESTTYWIIGSGSAVLVYLFFSWLAYTQRE